SRRAPAPGHRAGPSVRARAHRGHARRGGAPGAGAGSGAMTRAPRPAAEAAAGSAVRGAPVAAPAEDPLLAWRSEFPTVEATLHFISHSLGAMPRAVEEELRRYAQTWKARGIRSWEESWMAVPLELAATFESLLHAAGGTVSLHPNVTLAHA